MVEFQYHYIFCIVAVLLIMSVLSNKLSEHFNIPALLLFLSIGMFAGSGGTGKIPFDDPRLSYLVGTAALAFILFSGGLSTHWRAIRPVLNCGISLATIGVVLTAVLIGLFAHYVLNFPLKEGFLLGAIVSSTDAAAVFTILRSQSVGLRGRLQPLLEFESGSNDPMAVFLTIFMIGMLKGTQLSYLHMIPDFLKEMFFGAAVGFVIGKSVPWAFNKLKLSYDGLYHVLGIGTVLLTYGISGWVGGNGFLAVYVAGIIIGNSDFLYKNSLVKFHDGIGWLMQIVMFLALGLLVCPSRLPGIVIPGMMLALFLMFIARPVAVLISSIGSGFSFSEKLFLSWVGLRGAAPIVLATFPMIAGYEDSDRIFNLVFFIVLSSVMVQGKSLMFVAAKLGLNKRVAPRTRSPLEFERTEAMQSDMSEIEIPPLSPAIGKKVAELSLPTDTLILLIRRNQRFIVPKGNTVIEPSDCLMVLAEPDVLQKITDSMAPPDPIPE
ncbi:MAG: potassium/proton antiporter [Victivallaceae bacterium]